MKARNEHLAAVAKETSLQAQLRSQVALSPVINDINGHVVPAQTHLDHSNSLPVAAQAQLSYTPQEYGINPYSYGYVLDYQNCDSLFTKQIKRSPYYIELIAIRTCYYKN